MNTPLLLETVYSIILLEYPISWTLCLVRTTQVPLVVFIVCLEVWPWCRSATVAND